MKIGVTGASGFIGRKLTKKLLDSGYDVRKFVRRDTQSEDEIYWSPSKKEIDIEKFKELDAIIHLAGESIAPKDIFGFLPFAGGRWTKERKSRIYWSRKWAADLFVETYKSTEEYPKIFISASGIGVYGEHGDEIITESTTYNRGSFEQLVVEEAWEDPLLELKKMDVRVVNARKGIILGKGNVATDIFTLVSKLNISSPIGKGNQYFSWVSIDDVVNAYIFCIENENLQGPVNFVSPEPLKQKDFSKVIAKMMNKMYFFPPLPPILMKIAIGWELGESLGLTSMRIIPEKLLKENFEFKDQSLEMCEREFTG